MDGTGLYEIERSLWNDPKFFRDSLRRDALLLFRRENRHWTEVRFSDQRVLSPTHDTRVLIYKATASWNDTQDRIIVRCSSIYALRSDEWKLVFHQETPIAA